MVDFNFEKMDKITDYYNIVIILTKVDL